MEIYKITHKLNGHIYIGQTKRGIAKRWNEHCRPSVINAGHCKYIGHAIKKYGGDAFTVELLGTYTSQEELDLAEVYFISYHNSVVPNGYNLDSGGNGKKALHQESKDKISRANKGQRYSPATEFKPGPRPHLVGSGNPMFGKTPTWAKPIECLETGKVYKSVTHAAKDLGCCRANIIHFLRGKRKTAVGLTFRYVEAA